MRHNYLTLIYLLVATLMAGGLQSCDDDYFNGGNGTKVTITATTAFSNTTSRAVYEDDIYFEADDIEITNYCFLLFDGNGKFVRAIDVAPSELPYSVEIERPVVGGNNYHAFLLGNVDVNTLGAISVIDDLKNCSFEINRMYNLPKEDEKNKFTWSGYLPFAQSTQSLDFVLNPNVAKITAKITNNSSESVIKSVRVKNVASKVCFAQNALNEYSPEYVTNVSEPTFIKYDIETFETPLATGENETISWYVPQNIQGEGTRNPEGNKANETNLHGGIPDYATYLEIDGVRTADNVTASYRVYPGINAEGKAYAEMTNFDVKADVIYNLDISISNDGIDDNSNITTGYKPNSGSTATAKIKLPENSNCYMIHPIGDRIADVTVYELPIDRINQYWQTVAGEDGTEADDHALTADSEWKVFVIWQDINERVITFCDEYGNTKEDTNANGEVYSPGEGKNPFYFKLNNNSTDPATQTYGNVVVGIRKNGVAGYCWSWHLWITDYNPDAAPAHGTDQGNLLFYDGKEVDKQGARLSTISSTSWTDTDNAAKSYALKTGIGNVQHYNSKYAPYWTDAGRTESSAVWDGSGIYANKWIMDRNLGSRSPNNSEIENPLDGWGLYYQFGRKDPFSYKITYDINGNLRNDEYGYQLTEYGNQWTNNEGQGTIGQGIIYPNTYFVYNGNWTSTAISHDWNSPTEPSSRGAKTLFDPCPPGWCVPVVDALAFGTYTYPRSNLSDPSSSVFQEYTRRFAGDVTTSNWAHSSVCVYINVEGVYKAPVYGTSSGQIDYRNKSNLFNSTNSLTRYGSRWRNFMVLYSTDIVDGAVRVLKSHYPLQGHIDGQYGTMAKIFHADGLTPIQNTVNTDGTWNDYLCCTYKDKDNYFTSATGLQLRLWGCERGSATQGTLVNSIPSTMDYNVNARQERRNSFLYLRFHGTSCHLYAWNASNGFNVRCIQEPD